MAPTELEPGMVVQLSPGTCRNPMLAACFMVITKPKSFGAQGYIQTVGSDGMAGGLAYYSAGFDEMDLIGRAEWTVE